MVEKYHRNEVAISREGVFQRAGTGEKVADEGQSAGEEAKIRGQVFEEEGADELDQYGYHVRIASGVAG